MKPGAVHGFTQPPSLEDASERKTSPGEMLARSRP